MDQNRPWFLELDRNQWLILIVAWLGWVFDVADTAIFNLAKVPMLTEMLGPNYSATIPMLTEMLGPNYSATIDAALLSVFLVGWAVGGLVFGILADKWGRSKTLVVTILLYCLFTGLTALCHTPWQVGIVRFLTALGIGGEWAAGAALVAEALPNRARAGAASFIQSAAAFGPILAASANMRLTGQPWQILFLIGAFPALLCVFIRLWIKEPESSRRAVSKDNSPLRELWSNPVLRRNAIVAMVIGVVGIAGAGTATYWAPNLVKAVSQGLPKAVLDSRINALTIWSHVGTLAGVFLVPWLCQIVGRKRTIFAFFLAAPIVLLVGLSQPTYDRLILVMPVVNFFAIGVSAAFVLYFPELFPTRMRATGAGLAYNVGRLFYVPIPLITAALIEHFGGLLKGGVATGVVLTGTIYILGIIAICFAPETKGKPLPE